MRSSIRGTIENEMKKTSERPTEKDTLIVGFVAYSNRINEMFTHKRFKYEKIQK